MKKKNDKKKIEALTHKEAKRANIPTVEHQSVISDETSIIKKRTYKRNAELDPQLLWHGKDEQNWSDLVVDAPPIFIQEKIHPKALIDDLQRVARATKHEIGEITADLFEDFDGIPHGVDKTEFYSHDQNWSNRMILGDSLQVMASLAEREGLQGKVQCIYFDPPYGIKFNSNFQWSTTTRDVKDNKANHITREPEMVRAFRDTWRDGIHSYLTYLRDRMTVARDLLSNTGSIFVQIGDENVHLVRSLLDEVFGEQNFVSQIAFKKNLPLGSRTLPGIYDIILWYAKDIDQAKIKKLYEPKPIGLGTGYTWIDDGNGRRRKMSSEERRDLTLLPEDCRPFFTSDLASSGYTPTCFFDIDFKGKIFRATKRSWKTNKTGMQRLIKSDRILAPATLPTFVKFFDDFPAKEIHNLWDDTHGATDLIYVVQTSNKVVQRCILMASDPGDLILDPTCGSGTTAYVSEQWGRRWITIDTSRVSLALARSRIMGARYPFYLLADSPEGQIKKGELTDTAPSTQLTHGNIRHGFVYDKVRHVTLRSVATNTEIDFIWESFEEKLAHLMQEINNILGTSWQEWDVPRDAIISWPDNAKKLHADWWKIRISRQEEIDASILTNAEFEDLVDKPFVDEKRDRVAGPFSVESLSPHRVLGVDHDGSLIDPLKIAEQAPGYGELRTFEQMILDNLLKAGVQQRDKKDRITFESIEAWPGGRYLCAVGTFKEGDAEKRAGILVGPEFGTVSRPDLVEAAREAGDAKFDVLITCAFNYDAMATEFNNLGKIKVLKARMNADLHMAGELKNTGAGNLFVIFGEPDMDVIDEKDGLIRIHVKGVDVFDPTSGEVRSDDTDGIACWFIDTDYNGESFFVRHAYFLGQKDPYKALKTTLKAEIDKEAWETLHSDISRPFERPKSGRIAVKVINHLGDEVLKVLKV